MGNHLLNRDCTEFLSLIRRGFASFSQFLRYWCFNRVLTRRLWIYIWKCKKSKRRSEVTRRMKEYEFLFEIVRFKNKTYKREIGQCYLLLWVSLNAFYLWLCFVYPYSVFDQRGVHLCLKIWKYKNKINRRDVGQSRLLLKSNDFVHCFSKESSKNSIASILPCPREKVETSIRKGRKSPRREIRKSVSCIAVDVRDSGPDCLSFFLGSTGTESRIHGLKRTPNSC